MNYVVHVKGMARRMQQHRSLVRQHMHAEDEVLNLMTIAMLAEEEDEAPHRGSVVGRRTVPRDRYNVLFRLRQDYFIDPPVFNDHLFRRRFVLMRHVLQFLFVGSFND